MFFYKSEFNSFPQFWRKAQKVKNVLSDSQKYGYIVCFMIVKSQNIYILPFKSMSLSSGFTICESSEIAILGSSDSDYLIRLLSEVLAGYRQP